MTSNGGLLRRIHNATRPLFTQAGYRFDVRRRGELKLGLVRKRFRNVRDPRRFLVLPGFGDSPISWLPTLLLLQPVLKRSYDEIVIFDFPGFYGYLYDDPAINSFDLMLETVEDAIDTLAPHTIMGHSLGGWLTARYAGSAGAGIRPKGSKRYEGPEQVILVNPAGMLRTDQAHKDWVSKFQDQKKAGFKNFGSHVFSKEPFWFRYVIEDFRKVYSKKEMIQFLDSFREEHLVDELLKQMRSKVWIVWGEEDTLFPADMARDWVDFLKAHPQPGRTVRGVVIRGAGHTPHVERRAATATVLGQILLGVEPGRWAQTCASTVGSF